MAKKPQPKPPPRAGGGARSAGPTLAQATGGKPGKVQSAAPVKKSLGLGLGLGARQRGNFQAAVQGGSGGQWLGNHPGVQQRIGQINPNSAQGGMQQARIQNFMGSGQSQRPPQPPTAQHQPPRGAQQLGPQPQAPLQMPQQQNYAPQQAPQTSPYDPNPQYGGGGKAPYMFGQGGQQGGPYGGAANDQNAINADPQGFQQWQRGYGQQGGQQGGGQQGGLYGAMAGMSGYGGPNQGAGQQGGGPQGNMAGALGQMGQQGGQGGYPNAQNAAYQQQRAQYGPPRGQQPGGGQYGSGMGSVGLGGSVGNPNAPRFQPNYTGGQQGSGGYGGGY